MKVRFFAFAFIDELWMFKFSFMTDRLGSHMRGAGGGGDGVLQDFLGHKPDGQTPSNSNGILLPISHITSYKHQLRIFIYDANLKKCIQM